MKHPSLRKRFLLKLLLILLPLVFFINLYNFKIAYVLRDQAASSGKEFSTIYMREIDSTLTDLRRWLINLSKDKQSLFNFSGSDPSMQQQERLNYTELLQNEIQLNPALDMAFVISTKFPCSVITASEHVSFEEYQSFTNLANEIAQYSKPFYGEWIVMKVPDLDECWFVSVVMQDDIAMGIVVRPQTLLSSMPFALDTDKKFVLAKHSGTIVMTTLPREYGAGIELTGDLSNYYMTGTHKNIIVSGAESSVGPFRLMMITSDSEVQSGISWVIWASFALLAISVFALIGVIVGFQKDVVKPLESVNHAIEKVGQAEFGEHLIPKKEVQEFVTIYDTFNRMTDQIKTLKIENYEQLIHKQQAELRFYQTQIKPHFILNCLTTIQNLAKQGKTNELIQFTVNFSNFARYLFRTDYTLVNLQDELRQVQSYISLQKLRYPDEIFFVSDMEENLEQFQIPAMLIQTLVENCMKHAMDETKGISIFVQCKNMENQDNSGLEISVEDNGCGFPDEILSTINDAQSDQTLLGFGLQNITAMLQLIYGSAATLQAENVPGGGAKVTILIFAEQKIVIKN